MASVNKAKVSSGPPVVTAEGAPAKRVSVEKQLRRSIMSCMLWENEFYENSTEIGTRIAELVQKVDPETVVEMAIEAREKMKLRHVPLWIARTMLLSARHKPFVAALLERVIQRPDELCEFIMLYDPSYGVPTSVDRTALAAQVKKGLARAFPKFDAYALGKYNRTDKAVTLRDVMFLVHPKPKDAAQAGVWKQLVDGTLATPDTWEVELSAGKDKAETFTRLITEGKLGGLAMLRNLRNMMQANVPLNVIRDGLSKMKTDRILPFRFISAARYAPTLEPELENTMFKCLDGHTKLAGHTVLLVDVSGSMGDKVSGKSEISRMDAACGLAMLLREVCESVEIITFSNDVKPVPTRRGFALRDAIMKSQLHGGTRLGAAVTHVNAKQYDRLIVITDEQSKDPVSNPNGLGYMINVASNINGVGYGKWNHIDGWSEAVVDYIVEIEQDDKR